MKRIIIAGAALAAIGAGAFGLSLAGAATPSPATPTISAPLRTQLLPPIAAPVASAPAPTPAPAPSQPATNVTAAPSTTTAPAPAVTNVTTSAPAVTAAPTTTAPQPPQPPAISGANLTAGQCGIAYAAYQTNQVNGRPVVSVVSEEFIGECGQAQAIATEYPGSIVVYAPTSAPTLSTCQLAGTCAPAPQAAGQTPTTTTGTQCVVTITAPDGSSATFSPGPPDSNGSCAAYETGYPANDTFTVTVSAADPLTDGS